jgi:beta-galactosidase
VSSIRLLCCASVIALATAVSTTAIAAPALPRAAYSFEAGWRMVVGDPTGAEKPDFDDSRLEARHPAARLQRGQRLQGRHP